LIFKYFRLPSRIIHIDEFNDDEYGFVNKTFQVSNKGKINIYPQEEGAETVEKRVLYILEKFVGRPIKVLDRIPVLKITEIGTLQTEIHNAINQLKNEGYNTWITTKLVSGHIRI